MIQTLSVTSWQWIKGQEITGLLLEEVNLVDVKVGFLQVESISLLDTQKTPTPQIGLVYLYLPHREQAFFVIFYCCPDCISSFGGCGIVKWVAVSSHNKNVSFETELSVCSLHFLPEQARASKTFYFSLVVQSGHLRLIEDLNWCEYECVSVCVWEIVRETKRETIWGLINQTKKNTQRFLKNCLRSTTLLKFIGLYHYAHWEHAYFWNMKYCTGKLWL